MPARFQVAPPVKTVDRAHLFVPDIVPHFNIKELVQRGTRLEAAALAYSARFAGTPRSPVAASGSAAASGLTVAQATGAVGAAIGRGGVASAPAMRHRPLKWTLRRLCYRWRRAHRPPVVDATAVSRSSSNSGGAEPMEHRLTTSWSPCARIRSQ